MDYELAKKLKEAGWNQTLNDWDSFYLTAGENKGELQVISGYETDSGAYGPYIEQDRLFLGWGDRPSDVEGVEGGKGGYDFQDGDYVNFGSDYYVKVPSLEELIEACGEIFGGLHRLVDGRWLAFIFDIEDSTRQVEVEGSTPTEAVANLWLQLHQNDNIPKG